MTIQIELRPEVAPGLAAQARANGMPLDVYVQMVVEQLAVPLHPRDVAPTAEQRAQAFRQWAENFSYGRAYL